MEYNAIFIHIHQNIRAYPRSKKKSALINHWENMAYWEESEQNEVLANKFVTDIVRGFGGRLIPGKFCNFCSHFSLETVCPALN